MEDAKECPVGVENSTRIDSMEKSIDIIFQKLEVISDKLDKQLPIWATFLLMILSSAVTGLLVK